jgi:hypothetical protein
MKLIERLKNLWALSLYTVSEAEKLRWETEQKVVLPEKRLATVVMNNDNSNK